MKEVPATTEPVEKAKPIRFAALFGDRGNLLSAVVCAAAHLGILSRLGPHGGARRHLLQQGLPGDFRRRVCGTCPMLAHMPWDVLPLADTDQMLHGYGLAGDNAGAADHGAAVCRISRRVASARYTVALNGGNPRLVHHDVGDVCALVSFHSGRRAFVERLIHVQALQFGVTRHFRRRRRGHGELRAVVHLSRDLSGQRDGSPGFLCRAGQPRKLLASLLIWQVDVMLLIGICAVPGRGLKLML